MSEETRQSNKIVNPYAIEYPPIVAQWINLMGMCKSKLSNLKRALTKTDLSSFSLCDYYLNFDKIVGPSNSKGQFEGYYWLRIHLKEGVSLFLDKDNPETSIKSINIMPVLNSVDTATGNLHTIPGLIQLSVNTSHVKEPGVYARFEGNEVTFNANSWFPSLFTSSVAPAKEQKYDKRRQIDADIDQLLRLLMLDKNPATDPAFKELVKAYFVMSEGTKEYPSAQKYRGFLSIENVEEHPVILLTMLELMLLRFSGLVNTTDMSASDNSNK